jgi:hypothetical protein
VQTREFNGSDSSSSESSHHEERKQTMPHQKPPATEADQEEEEPASTLQMATMAARARTNQPKQELDIFTKKIKSGLKDSGARKRQIEKSLGAKVQEAKDQMIKQATEQHDKFAATSSNNMNQCKKNVLNLVSNENHTTQQKMDRKL